MMDRPERTEDAIRGIARNKLKLGKKVTVETQVVCKEKSQKSKEKRIRKGTLVALYPHIFAVDFGGYVECFRYNQLFGGEETGVRV